MATRKAPKGRKQTAKRPAQKSKKAPKSGKTKSSSRTGAASSRKRTKASKSTAKKPRTPPHKKPPGKAPSGKPGKGKPGQGGKVVTPSSPGSNGSNAVPLDGSTIRIRMYRVGFGDCFLVSLPIAKGSQAANGNTVSDGYSHILVDCGVHAKGDIGTIGTVVNDIASITGKKLAVVIASHAHQDHIAGYDRFGSIFSTFEIGEVWLPWTWNPNDPQAVQLQKKQAALTQQLTQHFAALAATGTPTASQQAAMDAIANLKGNAHAIALLKAGFGVNAKVRYLKAGDSLPQPNDDLPIPGLTVSFLGPPQSTTFLAQMDPPAGQHYLQLSQGKAVTANAIQPFQGNWKLKKEPKDFSVAGFRSEDEKELHDTVGSSATQEALAFAIDQARNNESVVALLVYRGQYLLFPGDAQYGNWEWWLQNLHPENILPMVRFFKIAHHGSVNATPVPVLEQMADGKFAAMVSTQSVPWASIPLVNLMKRVNVKAAGKIVRSDWISVPGGPPPSTGAEPQEPASLPEGFTRGQLWFDYMINV